MVIFLLLVHFLVVGCWADDEYDKVFDVDVDVDSIIDNDRILDSYLRCFYNEGPCSSLGESVKGKITEIFSTVCGQCTEKQKNMLHHTLNTFIPKRPKDWERILSIYDPDRAYRGGMEEFIKSNRNSK